MYQLENNAIKFVQEHLVSKSLRYILGAREALKQHSFSDMNPQISQIFLESSRFFSGERGGGIHLRLIYSESWKKQSKAKGPRRTGPDPSHRRHHEDTSGTDLQRQALWGRDVELPVLPLEAPGVPTPTPFL